MNQLVKLILAGEILIYFFVLIIGMYFVRGEFPEKQGSVLGYGVIAIASLITVSIVVLFIIGAIRLHIWSVVGSLGVLMILYAPSVHGVWLADVLNLVSQSSNSAQGGELGLDPDDLESITDKTTILGSLTGLACVGLILYAVSVFGGNMFKTDARNGIAVFLATSWCIVILGYAWSSEAVPIDKQLIILTLSLFGTFMLANRSGESVSLKSA
jgi:hypothetical protein